MPGIPAIINSSVHYIAPFLTAYMRTYDKYFRRAIMRPCDSSIVAIERQRKVGQRIGSRFPSRSPTTIWSFYDNEGLRSPL